MGSLRFWFRGRVVDLDDVPVTMSVLHWLREHADARGTKEGCNQGDCGACTVVLAELVDGKVRLSTANACLLLMPMLHGTALFTVEDVGAPASMHPVQSAMARHGGSQCGFCTPGFVMSMWRMAEVGRRDGRTLSRADLADGLTGNLCRCTGYRPIVESAADAVATCAAADVDTFDWDGLADALARIAPSGSLTLRVGESVCERPVTEEELCQVLATTPGARMIAGGTDLVVAERASGGLLRDDVVLVALTGIDTLRQVTESDGGLVMGAAVPLEEAWAALTARLPSLARMWQRFASPAIRSRGTVGGNIATSSPIADLVPVLIALDAEVELRSAAGSRVVPLASFATGVRANVIQPGEYLACVRAPARGFERDVRAHKVSRRFDDDISSVSAVLALTLHDGRITDVRAVFGGLAITVRRGVAVEAALMGQPWTRDTLVSAQDSLAVDFAPIDDHRATGWYRMQAARGLLERWWLETGTDAPAVAHDVWALP